MTPLVLLHGFLGCAEDWQPLVAALGGERAYLVPDLPGHGTQPAPIEPGPTAFDETVAWVAERIEARFQEPVDVLGYSMGGRLAYGLVTSRPELLRRGVIVGGSPGIEDEIERRTRKRDDDFRARALERGPFEDWLAAWYAQPLFASLRAHPEYEAILARRLSGRPAALAKAMRALSPGIQPPLRHRLSQSAVPLLLIAGALDARYEALNDAVAEANAVVQAVTVADAGHTPHLEQPDEFFRIVRTWLERP